jgi:protein-S-isoprenylcysteine O-methyltransferase Ste14
MTDRTTGWVFVAVQAVLLAALVLVPGADHWPTPPWLRGIGLATILVGLGVVAVSSLRLGPALTATPVPSSSGQLATGGLYRYARHPIYTGVLLIVIAVTVRSGSLPTLAVGIATVAFFNVKARWEEERLAATYAGYDDYARQTPRFIPRP